MDLEHCSRVINKLRYAYKEIKKNKNNFAWWRDIVIIRRIICPILLPKNNGIYIVNEDWDNLIILDACRYDMFKELNTIEGLLEYRISRGTNTEEFLFENFSEEKYNDIVYVTANPFVSMHLKNKFYKLIPVWDKGWDEEKKTVLPSTMVKYTLDAFEKYPHKRFIVHFMQPHYPFINFTTFPEFDLKEHVSAINKSKNKDVWDVIRERKKEKKAIGAYKDNIRLVLPYVQKLVDTLPGKTVITADHGEALGERLHYLFPMKFYGHPIPGLRMECLVKVPWLIIDKQRRKIIEEGGGEMPKIKEKLKKLKKEQRI